MIEGTTKTTSGHYIVETVVEVVSLRDQFAMAALTGLLAALTHGNPADHIAKQAYAAADAMLEARKGKK